MNKEDRVSGYFDDPDERSGNSGSGLRAQLEEALAEIRSLKEQVTKDSTAAKTEAATELLKSQGIDPAVLQLNDSGMDPVEWVGKYAHLLGAKGTEHQETKIDQPDIQVPPDDDPALVAEREALAAMQGAATAGSQATVSNDLIEQMGKVQTEEELLRFFRENGGHETA